MPFLLHLALAVLPGLAWLWYFYTLDRYEREPARLILGTFVVGFVALGIAAPVEVRLLEMCFGPVTLEDLDRTAQVAFLFGVVAPLEEAIKFLAAWVWVTRSPDFNEPMDGVVYTAAAALGFATAENLAYLVSLGPHVILGRGILSCFLHASASGLIGYGWAEVRFRKRGGFRLVFAGFLAVLLHGIYDLVAIQPNQATFAGLLAILVIADLFLSRRIAHALLRSPFKDRPEEAP